MASFLSLLFTLITISLSSAATIGIPASVRFPVRKDEITLQHYTAIPIGTNTTPTNLVVNLGYQLTWFNCENYNSPSYRPVQCNTRFCREDLRGVDQCVNCNRPERPGCTNNTCGDTANNQYGLVIFGNGYATDQITAIASYEKKHYTFSRYAFACVTSGFMRNLARQTSGMTGLSRAYTSLPVQLSKAFKLPNKFALCLPASSGEGDIYIGGGPYAKGDAGELSGSLISTPLLINPNNTAQVFNAGDPSDEYFIGVSSIKIDGKAVSLNNSLLSIDRDGNGGTKLSTFEHYTYLHNSIYRAFARAYVSAAARKNMKRVAPVRPFGVCFSGKAKGGVPHVDLVLQNKNVKWRFNEENLLVDINSTVSCLGIRDGGLNPMTAIVLGGKQLENYLLEFDLDSSTLKFSPPLRKLGTNCSA